jgi:colicin import membrane protein
MKFRTSSIVSVAGHAAFLGWCLVTFTGKPLDAAPQPIPVDVISADQFSQITKGVEKAPQKEAPKPFVEKKADEKPPEELTPKVVEKKEVKPTALAEPTPPPPDKKPPEKQTEEKKIDPIAEALKKEEKKQPPKKEVKEQPKFDPNKIAALLDKRAPQRTAATGENVSSEPSLGRANGSAARISQSEIDALRQRISQCWNVPVGADGAAQLSVVFRVQFRKDGSVSRGPDIVEASASAFGPSFAESGKRAILQCQPYTMLRQETYDQWRDIEIKFTPNDMFRG